MENNRNAIVFQQKPAFYLFLLSWTSSCINADWTLALQFTGTIHTGKYTVISCRNGKTCEKNLTIPAEGTISVKVSLYLQCNRQTDRQTDAVGCLHPWRKCCSSLNNVCERYYRLFFYGWLYETVGAEYENYSQKSVNSYWIKPGTMTEIVGMRQRRRRPRRKTWWDDVKEEMNSFEKKIRGGELATPEVCIGPAREAGLSPGTWRHQVPPVKEEGQPKPTWQTVTNLVHVVFML